MHGSMNIKFKTVSMFLGTPYMPTGSGDIVPPIFILDPRLGLSASRTGRLIKEEILSILPLKRRIFVHSLCYFMDVEDFVK